MTVQAQLPTTSPQLTEEGSRRIRRLLVPVAVVLAISLAILGIRAGLALRHSPATNQGLSMPSSSQIEQNWGIRITKVDLLADGGLLEVRYQVVDDAKADRVHSGTVAGLPVISVEGTGKQVTTSSQMFTYHHGAAPTNGTSYSMIYGNAGGIVGPTSVVDIIFSDGSRLDRVPVSS